LSAAENSLFWDETSVAKHFTVFSSANTIAEVNLMAELQCVKIMNPITILVTIMLSLQKIGVFVMSRLTVMVQ